VTSRPEPSSRDASGVCYVLPYYAPHDDQHYAHVPRFLAELAKRLDLWVVVQRGAAPEIPGARMVMVQRSAGVLARYFELRRLARTIHRAGCRRFFVRISLTAATALLVPRIAPDAEVYYWNSGQGRGLWPSWREPRRRLRARIGDSLLRLVLRRATRVVTGPESMLEYMHREYRVPRERLLLLYNDVDPSRFRPLDRLARGPRRASMGLDRNTVLALFVGRLSRYKGGDYLGPLRHRLRVAAAGVQIVAVGEPQIELDRDATGVRYVGRKPNDVVPDYYSVADLFILPSRSEGFPRVLLEAMASALPVVAFDVGGVRDILPPEQGRFVVRSGDLQAFADAVARLGGDAALRSRLGRLNRERALAYSPDRVARMFVERIGASV